MPILEAVQTFAGITNENEFYSHHYLAEVFKGDIKDRLEAWDAQEAQHPGDDAHRAPQKRLQAWAQRWFALRGQVQRGKDEHERWQAFMQIQSGLLQALGYAPPPRTLTLHELVHRFRKSFTFQPFGSRSSSIGSERVGHSSRRCL